MAEAAKPAPPIVDPSPTQAPIQLDTASLDEVLAAYPAAASPQEVLDLKPNKAADATAGPHPQVSPTSYVHMSRPDGSDFLCPASNVEQYERKGFVRGATEEIEDIGAYWAAAAAKAPAKATSKTTTSSA